MSLQIGNAAGYLGTVSDRDACDEFFLHVIVFFVENLYIFAAFSET